MASQEELQRIRQELYDSGQLWSGTGSEDPNPNTTYQTGSHGPLVDAWLQGITADVGDMSPREYSASQGVQSNDTRQSSTTVNDGRGTGTTSQPTYDSDWATSKFTDGLGRISAEDFQRFAPEEYAAFTEDPSSATFLAAHNKAAPYWAAEHPTYLAETGSSQAWVKPLIAPVVGAVMGPWAGAIAGAAMGADNGEGDWKSILGGALSGLSAGNATGGIGGGLEGALAGTTSGAGIGSGLSVGGLNTTTTGGIGSGLSVGGLGTTTTSGIGSGLSVGGSALTEGLAGIGAAGTVASEVSTATSTGSGGIGSDLSVGGIGDGVDTGGIGSELSVGGPELTSGLKDIGDIGSTGGVLEGMSGGTVMDAVNSDAGKYVIEKGGKAVLANALDGGSNPGTAANTQASYEQQALDYLKERDALPRKFSEGALSQLAGAYGLEGGTGSQQELIDRARQSPIYQAMQTEGEDAILRNASATGGLRSGNVQANLAKYNQDLLGDAYQQQIQGLSGMSNVPGYGAQIPDAMTNIGSTLAGGQLAEQRRSEAERAQNIQLAMAAYKELGGMEGITSGIGDAYDWLTTL